MILRNIPAALQDHLDDTTTTMGCCWRITREDGIIFRLTDADVPVQLSDGEYTPTDAGRPSAIENTTDLTTGNLTVQQILSSDQITVDDLNAGLFDNAKVELYWINYENPGQGHITLFVGYFGQVEMHDDVDFEVELKSLSTILEQSVARQYTQQCDADFGDSRCGLSVEDYTYSGTVTAVTDNQIFTDTSITEEDNYYKYGKLTWTSGNNNTYQVEVKNQTAGQITLFLPMPYSIEVGDTFNVIAGCDKYFNTCKNKFDNVINFRGFPHVPGRDSIGTYPDAKD